MMKFVAVTLKLLTASIVFMITSIVFMIMTSSYLPRITGTNYYDHGCFDGVTNLMMEAGVDKTKDYEAKARTNCESSTKKLRDKGYLF